MSLVPDYADSSSNTESSSDSEEAPRSTKDVTVERSNASKLPTPEFINQLSSTPALPKTSVFTNPFIEAENEKQSILEKHVKMVKTADQVVAINGKKICWNYRKGKCRFGHNCKYAHDSDLQKTREQIATENKHQDNVICETILTAHPSEAELETMRNEAFTNNKKRKRPGLSQGLIPGKKVIKNYMKQQGKLDS